LFAFAPASPSQGPRSEAVAPKLEPVAETKLLMVGLTKPNFDGLGKMFRQKPADADAWEFARGQGLLIAEAGNLLMLRPPQGKAAQDAWLGRSQELRDAGTKVAKAAAEKDYVAARAGMAKLANACNKCHESFRVATRVALPDAP
jgi:cytochrome c556